MERKYPIYFQSISFSKGNGVFFALPALMTLQRADWSLPAPPPPRNHRAMSEDRNKLNRVLHINVSAFEEEFRAHSGSGRSLFHRETARSISTFLKIGIVLYYPIDAIDGSVVCVCAAFEKCGVKSVSYSDGAFRG